MGNGHSNSGTNKSTNQHVDTSQSQQHEEPKKRTPLQDLPTSSTRNNANQHSNIVGDAIPSKKEQQQKKEKKNFLFFPQKPQQKDEEDRSTLRTEQDPLLLSTSIPTQITTQQVATLTNPLIDNTQATAVAIASAQIINESASQIKKATSATGFLTFRTLGLMGGIAMILSNFAGVIDRFMSFQFASGLSAFYGIFFGILIVLLEMPNRSYGFLGGQMNATIRWYCKFLEYTWGRGVMYVYVGSIQVVNFNILDWIVGSYMIFVGVIALASGIATARDLRKFQLSIISENELKQKFHKYDLDGNGTLDAKELTLFVRESGVNMTRNEIASTFLALDKNFDDRISYEEFYMFWMGEQQRGDGVSSGCGTRTLAV